jgi:phosphoribosylanthranilate isomerase
MKIKICGITCLEDALTAADLGADALGFIFARESKRAVSAIAAHEITSKLPPFVTAVGVFADQPREEVEEIIRVSGVSVAQIHGSEGPEYFRDLKFPAFKAFRIRRSFDLSILSRYPGPAFLLDTYIEGEGGGTGRTFDWSLAVKAGMFGRVILSGGLTSENVREAIDTVCPYAVDVSSGVESAPGRKDPLKLKAFFRAVQARQFV